MRKTITIDPVTRIEGHLKIEVLLDDNGIVKEAKSSGTLYRGFEKILKGREPRDANHITQRICGVCPVAHATASAFNLDSAFGITDKIPDNGRIIRNLILASNFLHNSLLHFYHLAALDYIDVSKASNLDIFRNFMKRSAYGPFLPQYSGGYRLSDKLTQELLVHYVKALDMRKTAQEMLSIFGGKMPHNVAIVPGGANTQLTVDKITSFRSKLDELEEFVENFYIGDVLSIGENYRDYLEIGRGCRNLLSFGVFPLGGGKRAYVPGRISEKGSYQKIDISEITEEVEHSWYENGMEENYSKEKAYSWIKSPRYEGKVYEVGPLARVMINCAHGNSGLKKLADEVLDKLNVDNSALFSCMGRHVTRAIETKSVISLMHEWVEQLKPGEPAHQDYPMPADSKGEGITDAPRGALGHWIEIRDGKIFNYRVISPTTWNASPMDSRNQPGPIEQALIGVKVEDEENPVELLRVVRSFDPCLACAVHMISINGKCKNSFNVL